MSKFRRWSSQRRRTTKLNTLRSLWDHARRVVVVVKPERTETGGYSRYYLVTNLPKAEYPGADYGCYVWAPGQGGDAPGRDEGGRGLHVFCPPRPVPNRTIATDHPARGTDRTGSVWHRACAKCCHASDSHVGIPVDAYWAQRLAQCAGASAARPCLAIGDVPSSIEADTTAMPQKGLVKPAPAALPGQPAESLALPCAAPQDRESAAGVNRSGGAGNSTGGETPRGYGAPSRYGAAIQRHTGTKAPSCGCARGRRRRPTGWAAPCSRLGHRPWLTRQRHHRCAAAGAAYAHPYLQGSES